MRVPSAGGGWQAIKYAIAMALKVGPWRLWRAMRSRNACKTCALGMGGQQGGMRNEQGRFPEVCKKSLQAMTADMQGAIASQFFTTYSLHQLQALTPRELEAAGRITTPLVAGPGATHWRELSWDEALDRVARRLRVTPAERAFFYFSGRSANEAAFLLQLFARVYGSNHVNNCSYYCHQASGVGLNAAIGTGTATLSVDDVDKADLVFLLGGNPASNHPRLMTHLMHLRRRGGAVVVVNPVREPGLVRFRVPSDPRSLLFGSSIASHYVQISIGGDIGFLIGVGKALLAEGAVDRDYLAKSTEGWADCEALLASVSWDDIEASSGVARAECERVAAVYARSQRAVFAWTMGITHHQHGVENVQWIVNLALMRGMVGRPGCGLLPIRGHSNVQGIGSMGVTPNLKAAIVERLARRGINVPTHLGLDTMGCMEAAAKGDMAVGWALGGNLYGSNPDAAFAKQAMARLEQMVYFSTTLNTGHMHGLARETIILPVLARDEEPQPTTQESMFNFVRLSDGGPSRLTGPRSEAAVIAALAERILGGGDGAEGERSLAWRDLGSASRIRQLIATTVPGYEPLANIDQTRREFTIAGRILAPGQFPTPSGKARLHPQPMPPPRHLGPRDLCLMTVRSEGQFNTVVYEDTDIYRGQERRDVILMNPDDMARLGIRPDEMVCVQSAAGRMTRVLARPFAISRGGALMYYPEANVLVERGVDPQARTPAFKATRIEVQPMPMAQGDC